MSVQLVARAEATGTGLGDIVATVPDDLAEIAARSGFTAAVGQTLVVANDATALRVLAGAGPRPDGYALRSAAGALARALQRCGVVSLTVPVLDGIDPATAARAVAEGAGLGGYRYVAHKRADDAPVTETVEIVHPDVDAIAGAVAVAQVTVDSVALARDLANETPARMTARALADVAVALSAEHGLGVDVWDEDRVAVERLGLLAAVNAGSAEPPRVIWLEHRPADPDESVPHVVLVGKGITFDSGGLSLKRPEWMYDMKGDMGGAAAVVAALVGAARLDVAVRVTGIVMATDNLPGPDATKPGEIVAARNGTTVEILDTDAEGRLVLADGLCLAAELEPDVVIDVATLTGYARTLGTHFTPMFATDDDLATRLDAAATAAGERVWRLPLIEALDEALEAPWADLRNIPDPDDAGTTAPAVFLRRFVGERRYAHLDIGETGFSAKAHGDTSKGCTGAMARTLIELVRTWA